MIKAFFDKEVFDELATNSVVKRAKNDTNLEGDEASRFLNAMALGSDDPKDFDNIYHQSFIYYAALILQGMSGDQLPLTKAQIVSALKSLD